jgi:formate-dependent nitrite reductase membrane component NrfD
VADKSGQQVPFDAGWPIDLQHRADPNRVTQRTSAAGALTGGISAPIGPQTASEATAGTASRDTGVGPVQSAIEKKAVDESKVPAPSRAPGTGGAPVSQSSNSAPEPSYYDISLLKAPVWKWEIANYFFLGGLSAGAYAVARMAERGGGEEYRDIARTGAHLALLTFLPCPPLLIHDLGDPKRFHHMLRIFKPTSPMSFGTWSLLGYSGMAAAESLRQLMLDLHPPHRRGPAIRTLNSAFEAAHDAVGIPFSLLVAGYTGVLLSCTANPLWSKSKWLGPLFSASAVATGASATSLAMAFTNKGGGSHQSHRALEKIDSAAHLTEAVCLAGFLKETGQRSATLTRGKMKKHFAVVIGGMILSELLKILPLPRPLKRIASAFACVAGLASGFSLRWAMIHGGHEAANDPRTARMAGNGERRAAITPR